MIKYIPGDLFEAIKDSKDTILIPHVVNTIFAWGRGFVVPLAKHYPKAKQVYKNADELNLGITQFVEIDNVIVANMIAQEGIGFKNDVPPIRYEALKSCMLHVKDHIKDKKIRIVTPMFGAFLAGGDWTIIEGMIGDIWKDIDVDIHFFPNQMPKIGNQMPKNWKYVEEEDQDGLGLMYDIYDVRKLGVKND